MISLMSHESEKVVEATLTYHYSEWLEVRALLRGARNRWSCTIKGITTYEGGPTLDLNMAKLEAAVIEYYLGLAGQDACSIAKSADEYAMLREVAR